MNHCRETPPGRFNLASDELSRSSVKMEYEHSRNDLVFSICTAFPGLKATQEKLAGNQFRAANRLSLSMRSEPQ